MTKLSVCVFRAPLQAPTLNSNLILFTSPQEAGSEMLNNMVASFSASNKLENDEKTNRKQTKRQKNPLKRIQKKKCNKTKKKLTASFFKYPSCNKWNC
jgi:hypothetical protein